MLAFIGNAWADYTCTLATSEVEVKETNSGSNTGILSLGETAQVKNITIEIRSGKTTEGSHFNIGTTSGGTDLWNARLAWNTYPATPSINQSYSPAKGISAIYFENLSKTERYYRNMTLTVEALDHNFGSVVVGESSQWTALKVLSGSNTKPTLTSTDERFKVVSVGTKSGNYYPVTVSFTPTEGKLYSADIKLGDEVVATVSGTGTRAGECAAQTFSDQTVERDKTSNAIGISKNEATISFSYSGTGTASKVSQP
ncbi:MAG: hypothetical protein SPK91_01735 [Bacteroidales bacterium]|nr:hypothetical protein [Bacteroidales bacterium]